MGGIDFSGEPLSVSGESHFNRVNELTREAVEKYDKKTDDGFLVWKVTPEYLKKHYYGMGEMYVVVLEGDDDIFGIDNTVDKALDRARRKMKRLYLLPDE